MHEYIEPAAETQLRRLIMGRCPFAREDLRILWHRAHRDWALRVLRPELSVVGSSPETPESGRRAYKRGWNDAKAHDEQTMQAFASVREHERARADVTTLKTDDRVCGAVAVAG
jgi:hypothetical protein